MYGPLAVLHLPLKRQSERVQPLHRAEPRATARRPATGSLRPVRVRLAGRPVADGHHPQRQSAAPTPCTPMRSTASAIDNDGDLLNDIAFSYVFSEPRDGKQTVDVYLAADEDAESAEAVGEKIFSDVPVSFVGDEPHIATSGDFTFFAGARSDAFFFDFDGIKNLFDTSGKRNFTDLTSARRITLDGRGFQHRGQRLLHRHRDADQLPRRRPRHQDLGPLQPAPRRRARCTSTAPATRRSAASSTPTTPRRSTTPASRSTTGNGGSTCSSI